MTILVVPDGRGEPMGVVIGETSDDAQLFRLLLGLLGGSSFLSVVSSPVCPLSSGLNDPSECLRLL